MLKIINKEEGAEKGEGEGGEGEQGEEGEGEGSSDAHSNCPKNASRSFPSKAAAFAFGPDAPSISAIIASNSEFDVG